MNKNICLEFLFFCMPLWLFDGRSSFQSRCGNCLCVALDSNVSGFKHICLWGVPNYTEHFHCSVSDGGLRVEGIDAYL